MYTMRCYFTVVSVYLLFYRLAAVNFFLGCVGVTQVTRILLYQRSVKDGSIDNIVEDTAKDIVESTKKASKDAVAKVKDTVSG